MKKKIQRFINKLYLLYYKAKMKKKKGVTFAKDSRITSDNIFEGNNYIGEYTSISNSNIGYGTYISSECWFQNVNIGRYCSIASEIKMVSAKEHPKSFVSTSPAFHLKKTIIKTYVNEDCYERLRKCENSRYLLIIGNDVWVGTRAIIVEGITIGDGAIIGAGAVVTKDVPPYAIVAGVPAKVIGYRFNEEQIAKLLQIKWWDKPEEWIKEHAEQFTDIERFINCVESSRD